MGKINSRLKIKDNNFIRYIITIQMMKIILMTVKIIIKI